MKVGQYSAVVKYLFLLNKSFYIPTKHKGIGGELMHIIAPAGTDNSTAPNR
jgi:hypothetical protein